MGVFCIIKYKTNTFFLCLALIQHTEYMPLDSHHVCAFVQYLCMLLCKSIKHNLSIMLSVKEKHVCSAHSLPALTSFPKSLPPSMFTEGKLNPYSMCPLLTLKLDHKDYSIHTFLQSPFFPVCEQVLKEHQKLSMGWERSTAQV